MKEFVEVNPNYGKKLLSEIVIDGPHRNCLYEHLCADMGSEKASAVFSNAKKALGYFSDPKEDETSKVLCLGKVQSGKTSFFIAASALAFDNGYKIAYLFGGTKNKLKKQNKERVEKVYSLDSNIVIKDINDINSEEINDIIESGKVCVLLVLKNNAQSANLGKAKKIASELSGIPSLIIDDEGDEATPGAPKKKKEAATHRNVKDIIATLSCCTFLSVTATPQANILLSTLDEISPDFVSLVYPGKGYTGGNAFHDVISNQHIITINDAGDFEKGIPGSFKECLHFFIFACCLKDDGESYSMLVHPSHLNAVHLDVANKIVAVINMMIECLSPDSPSRNDALEMIIHAAELYDGDIDFDVVQKRIPEVLQDLTVEIFNMSTAHITKSDKKYRIVVGGEMLGRGLTIKNLIVTYMYRDSKECSIDTLYQRARWFGYKEDYFDVCRVYLPIELQKKFIAIVESENDLWNSIKAFSACNYNFKEFPRLFQLNYSSDQGKLLLTRKTVSGTIPVERINPGYSECLGVNYTQEERKKCREQFECFLSKWASRGKDLAYDTSGYQTHKIIEMHFSELYNDYLKSFIFPKNAYPFGPVVFKRLAEEDAIIKVMIMRYKSHERRKLDLSGLSVEWLLQGRNDGTKYDGDKALIINDFCLQIHLVYHDDDKKDDYIPMFALNNPITSRQIGLVTGDNYYGN